MAKKSNILSFYSEERHANDVSVIVSALFKNALFYRRVNLDLRCIRFSVSALVSLSAALTSQKLVKNKVTLMLDGNRIDDNRMDQFTTRFLQGLYKPDCLHITLSDNLISDKGIEKLLAIERVMGCHFSYKIGANRISGTCFPALLKSFLRRESTCLSLRNNCVDNRGFAIVTNVLLNLKFPARAWCLDLSENRLGDDAMQLLSSALMWLSNTHLFSITLAQVYHRDPLSVKVSSVGARCLALAFQSRLIPYGVRVLGVLPNQPEGRALQVTQKENQYYYSRVVNLLLRVHKEASIIKERSSVTIGMLKLGVLPMALIVEYIAPLLVSRFSKQFLAISQSTGGVSGSSPRKKCMSSGGNQCCVMNP